MSVAIEQVTAQPPPKWEEIVVKIQRIVGSGLLVSCLMGALSFFKVPLPNWINVSAVVVVLAIRTFVVLIQ